MTKIKPYASCMLGAVAALCLSGCETLTGAKPVSVDPLSRTAGAVVMLDPASDDSMLPAIGEQMSQGRVTIYSLNGPSPSAGVISSMNSAPVALGGAGMIPPPIGVMPESTGDVTVYSLDTGAPLAAKAPPVDIRPQIAPMTAAKLDSPFAADGTIATKPVKAKASAKKAKTTPTTTTKRPKRGMTY